MPCTLYPVPCALCPVPYAPCPELRGNCMQYDEYSVILGNGRLVGLAHLSGSAHTYKSPCQLHVASLAPCDVKTPTPPLSCDAEAESARPSQH